MKNERKNEGFFEHPLLPPQGPECNLRLPWLLRWFDIFLHEHAFQRWITTDAVVTNKWRRNPVKALEKTAKWGLPFLVALQRRLSIRVQTPEGLRIDVEVYEHEFEDLQTGNRVRIKYRLGRHYGKGWIQGELRRRRRWRIQ